MGRAQGQDRRATRTLYTEDSREPAGDASAPRPATGCPASCLAREMTPASLALLASAESPLDPHGANQSKSLCRATRIVQVRRCRAHHSDRQAFRFGLTAEAVRSGSSRCDREDPAALTRHVMDGANPYPVWVEAARASLTRRSARAPPRRWRGGETAIRRRPVCGVSARRSVLRSKARLRPKQDPVVLSVRCVS